jgi:hypothetical protein
LSTENIKIVKMESQKMDDRGTDAMKAHLGSSQVMEVRQTRRGWLQECLGCEARNEFKYFIDETQVAHSLEDANCCCRIFCAPIHSFDMVVKELNTDAELLSVHRPVRCCAHPCKCCCYQEITVSSGGQELGSIKEQCYFCVESFKVHDPDGKHIYTMHPPTCCGGFCNNCFTEGNPICGKGCCKTPYRVYSADLGGKTGGDAPFVGKILKKPKSIATEVFTDAEAFTVDFPEGSTPAQKAVLVGGSVFLNAMFYEGGD